MNINETSSYKKAKRLLFKQNCLKRSLFYVELQVGFEPTTCSLQGSCTTTVLSRCSKLIAYMNLIKKVMLSNASTPSFGLYAQLSSVV